MQFGKHSNERQKGSVLLMALPTLYTNVVLYGCWECPGRLFVLALFLLVLVQYYANLNV